VHAASHGRSRPGRRTGLTWRRGAESGEPTGPEDRYADLVFELAGTAGITPPRGGGGFGRTALRFHNKIFAMLVRGRLVLKLPVERVGLSFAAGRAES
jgi:hypothetical protein